jgi:hypothetical protein
MQYLLNFLNSMLGWVYTFTDWAVNEVIGLIMTGLAAVLSLIPVPAFLTNAGGVMGAMPPGVAYLAQAFEIPAGVAILISAYTIRFFIRRLPIIG